MLVSAMSVALHFSQSRSLKDKRRLLKSIIEKVRYRFDVCITEVADQNLWQKATVGIAYISLNEYRAQEKSLTIEKYIISLNKADISQADLEILNTDV